MADSSANAQIQQDGVLLDTHWPTGYQAISALLMKNYISNEFVTTDAIGADTDWILTMPTRQYHIDSRYAESNTPVAPFVDDNFACEEYGYAYWNREQQIPSAIDSPLPGFPIPPQYDSPKKLCFSANNIVFYDGDRSLSSGSFGIFSSHFPKGFNSLTYDETGVVIETFHEPETPSYFDIGWMSLTFGQAAEHIENNRSIFLHGLPVIGFAAQTYANNYQPGFNKSYAAIFAHKYSRQISHEEQPEKVKPMSIAQDNKGQVLLFPYYTVKNGLNTLISIVNTTNEVKAVKIRFLEGRNSRNVLDFNLYLPAYDVWAAGLVYTSSTIDGYVGEPSVKLITIDNSCTVPEVISGQEFLPYAYTGDETDGYGLNMDRSQEGSIEIIEMGSLGSAADINSAYHNVFGIASCSRLHLNWAQPTGKWALDPNDDMLAPDGSGGLFGSVSLIDVVRGVDMTYDATAIVNFSTEENHTSVGSLTPNLSTGTNSKTRIETDDHGIVSTTWGSPLNAVTALFMQSEVSNDYVTEPSINAITEWVNFYPTRRFYIDPLFSASEINQVPFLESEFPLNHEDCEGFSFISHNRDQQASIFDGPIPPGIFPPPQHCWGVNTASVNNLNGLESIFASELQMDGWFSSNLSIYETEFNNGWMKNTYYNSLVGTGDNGETHEIFGLPILGFTAQRYINNNSEPGVIANYAVIHKNISKRKFIIEAQQ